MSKDFSIDASSLARAAQTIGPRFKSVAGRTTGATLQKAGNVVARRARANASRHRRTGRLLKQIRSRKTGAGLTTEVRVKSGGRVAHLIVGGTKAHEIGAKTAQALAIREVAGGEPVAFAPVVTVSGVQADPYFARGIDDAEGEMNHLFDLALDQMAGEIVRGIA